ncbi:MAG: YigZ family protein [Ruminococcaceae bacterium]|nr:YigZ family protein [Oscillospiraceae bacterium]
MKIYKTLGKNGKSFIEEKKSKFYGNCASVKSREEAVEFISLIKSEHRMATHNVTAYSIKLDNLVHSSDDGEPQGTAGAPVLDVLRNAEIVDAVIVVTRYFGGKLLGKGGLVRAYSKCASLAVEDAGISVFVPCIKSELLIDYPILDITMNYFKLNDIRVDEQIFAENVRVVFTSEKEKYDEIRLALMEITRGREPEIIEETYESF